MYKDLSHRRKSNRPQSTKTNASHKHARMESKLVTQTPTGQSRRTDAFITFVSRTQITSTKTRHTDANQISKQSTETNASNKHARMESKFVKQTPTGQIRYTDEGHPSHRPVAQAQVLN